VKHLLRSLLIVALATCERTLPARAQALCSYDQCALRLHRGSLVQGLGGTRVARLRGWFSAPRIDLLENAGDSTRQHYLAFRALYHQGAKFRTASLALVMATAITMLTNPHANHYYVPLGLAVVSIPVGNAGYERTIEAWDHLQKAMWFYNRDLPRSP